MTDEIDPLTRRDVIKLGAAAVATSLGGSLAAQTPPAFFTPAELALVDELAEMIIPTDTHSPGARAAKVAAHIDFRVGEAWDPADRAAWREGLAQVDTLSRGASGKAFLAASPDERLALLTRMAANESKPQTIEERFFVRLKAAVVTAYYTSEIGIKREMEYKGNSYLGEFAGEDVKSR